jgi:SOS-response transcriptional repressor LexA
VRRLGRNYKDSGRRLGRDFTPKHTMGGEFARLDMLEFITNFTESHGYSPSFREIMVGCGLQSTSSVAHHLSVLRDLGKIEYQDNIARSVRVTS